MPLITHRDSPARYPAVLVDLMLGAIEAVTGSAFYLQVVLEFSGRLDTELLKQAVGRSLQIEPRFACRFRPGFFGAYWSRVEKLSTEPPLRVIHSEQAVDALHQVLAADLDPDRDGCLCVYLIRATSDTICIKLDHKMGDGQAVKQYAYMLAHAYQDLTQGRPLSTEPLQWDRSLRQLLRYRTRDERRALKEQLAFNADRPRDTHCWRLPPAVRPDEVSASSASLTRRLSQEEYSAVFRYACAQRATVNQVFMAAFMRAAIKKIPHASGVTPSITQTVDLRRYIPSSELGPPCNLSGLMELRMDGDALGSLDAAVAYVRNQMMTARGQAMGLPPIHFRIESNALLRSMVGCVPYWLAKTLMRRRILKAEAAGGHDRLTCTDMGALDSGQLSKFGATPKAAYMMPGAGRFPRLHVLGITTYCGTAHFSIGFSPRKLDPSGLNGLLDAMMADLAFKTPVGYDDPLGVKHESRRNRT